MSKGVETDLTQTEGDPGGRADVLCELQKQEVEVRLPGGGRVRATSEAPVRAPGSSASAMVQLSLAGVIPGLGVGLLSSMLSASAELALVVAAGMYVLVMGSGVALMVREQRRRP